MVNWKQQGQNLTAITIDTVLSRTLKINNLQTMINKGYKMNIIHVRKFAQCLTVAQQK